MDENEPFESPIKGVNKIFWQGLRVSYPDAVAGEWCFIWVIVEWLASLKQQPAIALRHI